MKKYYFLILLFGIALAIILLNLGHNVFNEPIHSKTNTNRSAPLRPLLPENISQEEIQTSSPSKETMTDQMSPPDDIIEGIVGFLSEEMDSNVGIIEFEADLRASLAAGWTPPWQHLAPDITLEQARKMSTSELAKACFTSGVFPRTLLIYDDPRFSFSRLKILYPCYAELFERDDLFEGVLNTYSFYTALLKENSEPNSVVDGFMGLESLPKVFYLAKMKERMKGKKILFIQKQLESLKSIRQHIDGDENDSYTSSTSFFSATTPFLLINITLEFMQRESEKDSTKAVETISKLNLPQKPTMGQIKNYMDISIAEIEEFINCQIDKKEPIPMGLR